MRIKKGWAISWLMFVFSMAVAPLAYGDLSGSFDLDLAMLPEETQTEAVEFHLDLQANLVLNLTISGLTLGIDLGTGPTGIEFAILKLSTALGALAMFSETVYATPFYHSSNTDTITAANLHPTQNALGQLNGTTFVKARLNLDFNIAGFVVSNLLILEDVDFPNPFLYENPLYHVGQFDMLPDLGGTGQFNQTPSIAFGDLITLQGQTKAEITLTSQTGLCVILEENAIKKRSWPESVMRSCIDESLAFTFERLKISRLEVGDLTLSATLIWEVDEQLEGEIEIETRLLDLLDVSLKLVSIPLTQFELDSLSLKLITEHIVFTFLDEDGDWRLDRLSGLMNVTLNPNQNPAKLTLFGITEADRGLVLLETVLLIKRDDLSFSINSLLAQSNGQTTLSWQSIQFNLNAEFESSILSLNTTFKSTGLSTAKLGFSASF